MDVVITNTGLDNTYEVVLVNASSGPLTLTLPSRVSIYRDKSYTIKKIDSTDHIVTISGTIDDGNSLDIKVPNQVYTIKCDGTQWWILNN